MEEEELIRRDMEDTREALTEKVETLERRLTNSVQESAEAVKHAMDMQGHFERHPWLMLGGSLLGGYLVATMLAGQTKKLKTGQTAPALPAPEPPHANGRPTEEKEQAPAAAEGWLGEFEPEIGHLKRLALGVALGTVREVIVQEAPPHMGEHLREIVDDVTKKVGGEVLPSSDWGPAEPQSDAPPTEGPNGALEGLDLDKPRW